MADTQITRLARFSVNKRQPLLLVTDDASLEHLIALEAHELAIPMLTLGELPAKYSSEDTQAVVLDLDSLGGMQAALYLHTNVAIGICRQASTLPTMLLTRVLHVLERPFATDELRALLCRISLGGELTGTRPFTPHEMQTVTPYILALIDETTLRCGEHTVTLTPKEAVLMRCLLSNRGKTLSREQLCACLNDSDKPSSEEGDSNKIEVYLCRLRRKLEAPTGRKLITTVRGVGYRLE